MKTRGRPAADAQRVETVKIGGRIPRPLYNATQRWMNNSNSNLTETIEKGLRSLEGMAELEKDEQEHYEASQTESSEADSLAKAISEDQDVNGS